MSETRTPYRLADRPQRRERMAGVLIERKDVLELFGIDVDAVEAATGRKVTACWRNSTNAEGVPAELAGHVYGPPGLESIMSSVELYFDLDEQEESGG